jgi:hypothetical protein
MESKPALHRTGARRLTSAKPTALSGQALVLRIELRDTNPLVYRTILVPATITLPKLHVTLLMAMGWQGGHLHEFIIDDTHYGELDPDYPEPDLKNQQRVRLTKALGTASRFDYVYDFGDSWWHHIHVLERTQFQGPLDSPWCLDGANACPPEDVGGIPGYEDFLAVISDPKHPEYENMVQWCGGTFDAAHFDLEDTNRRLMEIQL